MKTLKELNEGRGAGDYSYAVGKRSSSSPVIHFLRIEPEGGVLALCNQNGMHTGRIVSRLDTADITCKSCQRILG